MVLEIGEELRGLRSYLGRCAVCASLALLTGSRTTNGSRAFTGTGLVAVDTWG